MNLVIEKPKRSVLTASRLRGDNQKSYGEICEERVRIREFVWNFVKAYYLEYLSGGYIPTISQSLVNIHLSNPGNMEFFYHKARGDPDIGFSREFMMFLQDLSNQAQLTPLQETDVVYAGKRQLDDSEIPYDPQYSDGRSANLYTGTCSAME